MSIRHEGLARTYVADAAIAKCRIVKITGQKTCAQAAAVSDKVFGVADSLGAALGETLDVILDGVATVEYGGNVAVGALLTTDADGRAVTAAPSAGANNAIIGLALVAGVVGDLGSVLIRQGMLQG